MQRFKLSKRANGGDSRGARAPLETYKFIPSGCTLLDNVIGGGWPFGRISNIVGDKSTGKTLLAIEACANLALRYPRAKIWYRETESAFDKHYAASLGLPLDRVDFGKEKLDTTEDFFNDLSKQVKYANDKGIQGLYILDSLDALSSDSEQAEEEIDTTGYAGARKAGYMSQLFRRLTRKIEKGEVHLQVISQIRDNIGVSFGRKTKRSGGHAMDFYASQVLYLAHVKTIYRTLRKQKLATGVRIRAKCDKNKISIPFRECEFTIRFGYGIEDLSASVDWLDDVKRLNEAHLTKLELKAINDDLDSIPSSEYKELSKKVSAAVIQAWAENETELAPKRRKYQ